MTEMEASQAMWKSLTIWLLVVLLILLTFSVLGEELETAKGQLNAVCASLSDSSEGRIREWNEIVYCLDVRGNIQHEASVHFRKYQGE